MKYNDIKKINKLYFTYQDVAKILSISEDSARVLCTRYVKQKYLIRLKRNFYIFGQYSPGSILYLFDDRSFIL
jgi:predicted transcriptional regulator of viral defense system